MDNVSYLNTRMNLVTQSAENSLQKIINVYQKL